MESIATMNERLKRDWGEFENQPRFRIVWSEDQFEKRLTYHTKEGFELLQPQMVEMPKYRQWIQAKWVLERYLPVPAVNSHELMTRCSYEPLWVFSDANGRSLYPKWEAILLILGSVLGNEQKQTYARYKDPESGLTPSDQIEMRRQRIDALQMELFGNETEVGDALTHKEGIVVPHNYGDDK